MASSPFPPLPQSCKIFCNGPQLWVEAQLLMREGRRILREGIFGARGNQDSAVSHLDHQANKYGAYREVLPNQSAYINIDF